MLPSDGISAEKSLYPQVGFITANQHVNKACLEEYEQGVQYNQGYNHIEIENLRIKQRREQFDLHPYGLRLSMGTEQPLSLNTCSTLLSISDSLFYSHPIYSFLLIISLFSFIFVKCL